MTGYGSSKGTSGKLEISIELKSVNNRFLDCNFRMPRIYSAVEDKLRAVVQKHISRGKVDVFVTVDSSNADNVSIKVNKSVADAYVRAVTSLSELYGLKNDLSALSLAKLPDVLTVETVEADEDTVCADLCRILDDAMTDFDEMRSREGVKLYNDIHGRLQYIAELTGIVEARSPETVTEYRNKLEARMRDVLQNTEIEESRILTEAAIFADKVAVDEETVRLRSHISQLETMLTSSEPVGRKLDFLVQEFNREANTIGSKCNDSSIARTVVDLKAEIEKIREQVQNVE